MTEEERIEFIKDKIAPLFDGMNVRDIMNILQDLSAFSGNQLLSCFTVSLGQKKTRSHR
jgi:hypothetical protein